MTRPLRKLLPGIKAGQADFDMDQPHGSTSGERRKEGQFITSLQGLVSINQLLIHGDADALQGPELQKIPDSTWSGVVR